MKTCTFLEQHLDWSIQDKSPNHPLVLHLQSCATCRELVHAWPGVEAEILSVENDMGINDAPESSAAERLIRRARSQTPDSPLFKIGRWTPAAAVAALAIAVVVGVGLFIKPQKVSIQEDMRVFGTVAIVTPEGAKSIKLDKLHSEISVPDNGRATATIGGDLLGIGSGARVRVDKSDDKETRISLLSGIVSVHAAHREPGASFVVVSQHVRVRVVGTRFSVAGLPGNITEVAVSEGQVEVSTETDQIVFVDANQRIRTDPSETKFYTLRDSDRRAIDTLLPDDSAENGTAQEDDRDLRNDAIPEGPDEEIVSDVEIVDRTKSDPMSRAGRKNDDKDLDAWRTWILNGRIDEAESALLSRVNKRPRDDAAWSLLADCYRKTGKWHSALQALGEVESLGNTSDSTRARFRAGVILQDRLHDHPAAAKKFEAYIHSKHNPLSAEASVRLAVAYLEMNRKSDARALLENVVQHHGGTGAAETAQKMLLDL